MKKSTIFLFCLSLFISAIAQKPVTTVAPSGAYGPGGTVETTVSTDEFGRTTTTEKYYDAQKRLREEFIKTRKYDNSGTEETTIQYRENGSTRTWTKWEKYDDGSKKMEHKIYDEQENVTNGTITIEKDGSATSYPWDPIKKKYKGYDDIAIISPDKKKDNVCLVPGFEVFAAYSILIGSFYPLGGHLTITHNLSSHIGIAADASFHRSKEGSITQSRSFIMIEGQYVFGDRKDCDKKMFADIHVLAGIGSDREKYKAGGYSGSSGVNGPVFGAGTGAIIVITTRAKARVQADVLEVKWGDKWFTNYRFSAGASVWF